MKTKTTKKEHHKQLHFDFRQLYVKTNRKKVSNVQEFPPTGSQPSQQTQHNVALFIEGHPNWINFIQEHKLHQQQLNMSHKISSFDWTVQLLACTRQKPLGC